MYIIFLSILAIFAVLVIYSVINGYRIKNNCLKSNNLETPKILEKSVTNTIRGVTIIMIMLAHIVQQIGDRLSIPFFGGNYIKLFVFSWGGVGVGLFFLLSGFGNMASLMKTFENPNSSKIEWILKRLIRLLLSFIISFIFVVLITKFLGICKYDIKNLGLQFIMLKLPDCSTWYLKIQILLYFIIYVSFFLAGIFKVKNTTNNTVSAYICAFLVLVYAIIANYFFELPDYWWKTSFCFVVGVFLYLYRNFLKIDQEKIWLESCIIVFAIILFSFSYFYTIVKPFSFFNLFFFSVISLVVVLLFDMFYIKSNLLSKIGNISLELYLIHIGLMSIIETNAFSFMKEWTLGFNIIVFIISSFIFAFITNYLNTKVMNFISLRKK